MGEWGTLYKNQSTLKALHQFDGDFVCELISRAG